MTLSALTILVVCLIAAAVVLLGLWAYSTANRLDRLHVRSDLAWQALDAALGRRAVVVRAIAADSDAALRKRLVESADRAERADRPGREAAENVVSAMLSEVNFDLLRPQLVAELADAEARVLLARRFHNDAVRDTLALRTRRLVRWLHLGGTAPLPTYFEIAENALTHAAEAPEPRRRRSARVVLLDRDGRVLLLRGSDLAVPGEYFWITVGGEIEEGESLRECVVRETVEETGLKISSEDLRGPMWQRESTFAFHGEPIRSEEIFFALVTDTFEPTATRRTDVEVATLRGHRWCDRAQIAELVESGEKVYPADLGDLLVEAAQVAAGTAEPSLRSIA